MLGATLPLGGVRSAALRITVTYAGDATHSTQRAIKQVFLEAEE
jgi:hypothetical protein